MYTLQHEFATTSTRDRIAAAEQRARYRSARRGRPDTGAARNRRMRHSTSGF
jgi:hypothetical protein